jgi:hypothetical protein
MYKSKGFGGSSFAEKSMQRSEYISDEAEYFRSPPMAMAVMENQVTQVIFIILLDFISFIKANSILGRKK